MLPYVDSSNQSTERLYQKGPACVASNHSLDENSLKFHIQYTVVCEEDKHIPSQLFVRLFVQDVSIKFSELYGYLVGLWSVLMENTSLVSGYETDRNPSYSPLCFQKSQFEGVCLQGHLSLQRARESVCSMRWRGQHIREENMVTLS